jgi:hypothetical protein
MTSAQPLLQACLLAYFLFANATTELGHGVPHQGSDAWRLPGPVSTRGLPWEARMAVQE